MTMNRYARMTMFWIIVFSAVLMSATSRSASAARRSAVQRIVVEAAVQNGSVPPSLALAVARIESNFDPRAHSSAGARGVMQIMPRTAWGEFRVRSNDLWDPRLNARLGVRYLEKLYHQYGERWDLALSHYNGGGIKRDRYGRLRVHSYTRGYVDKVLRASRRYERSASVASLVQQSRRVAAAKSRPEEQEPAYWMFDEPAVERDWRDYLRTADHWLEQADLASAERSRAPAARKAPAARQAPGRAPAARRAPAAASRFEEALEIEEPAYWEMEDEPGVALHSNGGTRPSEALERQISETRERFRESLAAEASRRRG
jgi:hypothetical protein